MSDSYVKYRITPGDIPNYGIMFVDHEKNHRSGHLSHALAQYGENRIIAFYSNCSGTRNKWFPGHNGFGWLEYKRSNDGGLTWDKPRVLPYSYDSFINQPFTVSCEKAVSVKENEIVAFCLRNENPNGWEPYLEPVVIKSTDGGDSWSDAKLLCDKKGRVYDAITDNGIIYVLMLANDDWLAKEPEHRYYIYRSDDGGESFALHGELPGDTKGHAYGAMVKRDDGTLLAYEYDINDEFNLVFHVSADMGKTWIKSGKSYVSKRIRNPQVAKVKGGYILHGRAGCVDADLPMDFVLYTSLDGISWDDGVYICHNDSATAYYSNNLVLDGGRRVLIQSSVPYSKGCVNISHWFLDIE
ncbi:MAG: exo-alpha-sialidase [Clostridia bacterium]|nr:exo-alpha-sialidase [Clostridia bacterium]